MRDHFNDVEEGEHADFGVTFQDDVIHADSPAVLDNSNE